MKTAMGLQSLYLQAGISALAIHQISIRHGVRLILHLRFEFYSKGADAPICFVTLVNPSFKENLPQKGQIPAHREEFLIVFLAVMDNGLRSLVFLRKQLT